jgi:Domain of unknown function (DUF4279)
MATITAWLFIESVNLTTDQITEQIGLPPDKCWRIGDRRGKTGKTYRTNSWTLESKAEIDEKPDLVGQQLQACLTSLLSRVRMHADDFRIAASGQTSGIYLGICANESPQLELKAATIAEINRLGVDLEIDLMV